MNAKQSSGRRDWGTGTGLREGCAGINAVSGIGEPRFRSRPVCGGRTEVCKVPQEMQADDGDMKFRNIIGAPGDGACTGVEMIRRRRDRCKGACSATGVRQNFNATEKLGWQGMARQLLGGGLAMSISWIGLEALMQRNERITVLCSVSFAANKIPHDANLFSHTAPNTAHLSGQTSLTGGRIVTRGSGDAPVIG